MTSTTLVRIFAGFYSQKSMVYRKYWITAVLTGLVVSVSGQLTNQQDRARDIQLNTITTAVPFLLIAPDSRAGALGDAGVALSPDANSMHWNPAKMAFGDDEYEIALSYSPWLRALVPDMNLAYLSGYKRMNDKQAFGAALRFFTLGNITFTDEFGSVLRDFKPSEVSLDVGFAQKFGPRFSGGLAGRFVNSNLTGGTAVGGANSKPGRTVAVDVSVFYTNDDIELGDKDAIVNVGMNVSNIGAKMAYTETAQRDFIPTNLKLGTAVSVLLDDFNTLTMLFDVNKLLVPTPPVYLKEDGLFVTDDEGNYIVALGRDPNVGVAAGIFNSFVDAPGVPIVDADGNITGAEAGSVFREELREFNLSGGLEYVYANQFAFRAGYFYEHFSKGNRQFVSMGAGLRYSVFSIDMSYLISTTQNNPLANTLRFTLGFSFANAKTLSDRKSGN
jgi:hypothetical protein